MKCFLSNSIAEATTSQPLLRLVRAVLAILLLAALPGVAVGQNLSLRTDHLADRSLAEALQTSFNLDERIEAGMVDPGAASSSEVLEIERTRIVAVMRGFGYLDAEAEWASDAAVETFELVPDAGPQYAIGAVAISLPDITDPAWAEDLEAIAQGVVGSVARGDIIGPLVRDLTSRIESSGFPFVQVSSRELIPDPVAGLALVRLVLDPGKAAVFGEVTLTNGRDFTIDRLMELVPFLTGERYSPEKVEALRLALGAQPDLRSVRVSLGEDVDPQGLLPVSIRVREAVAANLLTNGMAAGQVALLAVLGLLALRQVTVAAGGAPHSALVLSQTILSLIATALAAWFVARRFVEFAGIG